MEERVGGGGGHIEFNSGSNNSRGVAILFRTNLNYEITSKYSDNIGRVLWLNIKLKGRLCSLVNIYAPNGEAPQIHFYNHLHNIFEQNARENHLYFLGGDLNYISNPQLDRRGGCPIGGQKYKEISTRLNNIFSSYNLQDVWRIKNPTKPAFTWRRQTPRIQSRLDYWYIYRDRM